MDGLNFREFNKKTDIKRCAELAADAWPIVSSLVSKEDIPKLTKAYVEMSKIGSTWLQVALINDQVVGLLFGFLRDDLRLGQRLKESFQAINMLLKVLTGKYGKIRKKIKFLKCLIATERKVRKIAPKAGNEITLFIVDSKQQGKGIGRKLLQNFLDRAQILDIEQIYVYTDPLSNWRFYEKYGFSRKGEFIDDFNSYMKKKQTMGFVYTLKIKSID